MMGLSGGCFLVWPSKSGAGAAGRGRVMKLLLRAAWRELEYAERASLSGSEPVVGSEGVAFVLAPPHTPQRWPA